MPGLVMLQLKQRHVLDTVCSKPIKTMLLLMCPSARPLRPRYPLSAHLFALSPRSRGCQVVDWEEHRPASKAVQAAGGQPGARVVADQAKD